MEEEQAQQLQLAHRLKTIIKVGSSIKKWQKLARQSKDRYLRLNQLITTQAQYLNDLKILNQKMQIPLKQCGAISQHEEKQMFPNIQGMIHLSHQLYSDLSAIFGKWERRTSLIGQVMIRYSRFMLVYSDFFKNYQNTQRKLKLLVQNNEEAQQIEKNIGQQCKNENFLNLLSKPFQRALKYHLILRDYCSKTPKDHPDYAHLVEAIEEYHKVNQRNNGAIESKEKNQKLIQLDNIFPNIIGSDARYFIAQTEAMIFDMKIKCYLLSDRLLISQVNGSEQKEYLRIKVNNESFVSRMKDGVYFKNRLLLCGKKTIIHMTFKETSERDRFATYMVGTIQEIVNNQNFKQDYRRTRRNTAYSRENALRETTFRQTALRETALMEGGLRETQIRSSQFSYESLEENEKASRMQSTSERATASSMNFTETQQDQLRESSAGQAKRESITKSQSMLPKPPRIVVLGPIKRNYSSDCEKIYFLTKIQLPFPSDCHQILYIPEEDMQMIQRIARIVYYQHRDFINAPLFEELLKNMQCLNQIKAYQYKTLYFTLLLNNIFRHPEINKRLDIFAHKMGITEGFWLSLKYPNISCKCQYCSDGDILNTMEKYNAEMDKRNRNRMAPKTFYCPFRTFHVQTAITTMHSSQITLGIDRLFRVKCQKGFMEYRLMDNAPLDYSPSKQVTFNISFGLLPIKYDKHVKKQDRVAQIKNSLSKDLNIDLSEYQICLEIGGNNYILGDDEILYKLLENQQQPEKGFSGFFKNTFGTSQDTEIKVFVERIWWFVHRQVDILQLQKTDLNIDFFIESLASRMKQQEIQLNIKETITFYACYLMYKNEKNITQPLLECLVPVKKWKMLSSSVKTDMVKTVKEKYQKLHESFLVTEGSQFKKYMLGFLMKFLKDRPIWGVFMYKGKYISQGKQLKVRVGFDINTFVIKQQQKAINIYEQKISQAANKISVSSWQLRVKDEEGREHLVVGYQFEQMLKLLQLYTHYAKLFALAK